MLGSLPLALALPALVAASPVRRWSASTVDLGYAQYQGTYNETSNVQYWLGIKYGADTSGENRFRAPQNPANLGAQVANYSGPACPSSVSAGTGAGFNATFRAAALDETTYSEDCLYLDVYLPPNADVGDSRPVLVQLHGGGYVLGSTNGYAASEYLMTQPGSDFIFVDVSYRLGIFGFLAGSEVGAGGDYNAGLLDQQAALLWVHNNVHLFGGNPDEVTIWGVSAGAGSVMHQVIANGGKTEPQLFKSGYGGSVFTPPEYSATDPVVQNLFKAVVSAAGCDGSSDKLACLRSADTATLLGANYDVINAAYVGDYAFTPVVDGKFIQSLPLEALAAGKLNGRNVWCNHNLNEGLVDPRLGPTAGPYTSEPTNLSAQAEYIATEWPHYNASVVAHLQTLYSAETFGTIKNATEHLYGENVFGCPSLFMAEAFAKYRDYGYLSVLGVGSSNHGSDAPLYTGGGVAVGYPEVFATAWITNFVSFASGNYPAILPQWPQVETSSIEYLNWNTTADQTAVDNTVVTLDAGYIKRCNYLLSIGAVTPQ